MFLVLGSILYVKDGLNHDAKKCLIFPKHGLNHNA